MDCGALDPETVTSARSRNLAILKGDESTNSAFTLQLNDACTFEENKHTTFNVSHNFTKQHFMYHTTSPNNI